VACGELSSGEVPDPGPVLPDRLRAAHAVRTPGRVNPSPYAPEMD
jgi:hypothetical protein